MKAQNVVPEATRGPQGDDLTHQDTKYSVWCIFDSAKKTKTSKESNSFALYVDKFKRAP